MRAAFAVGDAVGAVFAAVWPGGVLPVLDGLQDAIVVCVYGSCRARTCRRRWA